jgi:hypothetical protein
MLKKEATSELVLMPGNHVYDRKQVCCRNWELRKENLRLHLSKNDVLISTLKYLCMLATKQGSPTTTSMPNFASMSTTSGTTSQHHRYHAKDEEGQGIDESAGSSSSYSYGNLVDK